MQIDNDPFPINALELQNPKTILTQLDQAELTKGKNVAIEEEMPKKMQAKDTEEDS